MALVIKRFKTALKGRKEYPNKNKSRGKCVCFKCGKSGHFVAQCPDNDDQAQQKSAKGKEKKFYKKKGEAHIGEEWESGYSSSDSDNEGLTTSAFNKSTLFPNKRHTCLMAMEKKVFTRETPKYTYSSDEEYDDDVDYIDLFKGLDRSNVDKINELIDALNDKNRLLEKQEGLLFEEHDKFLEVEKSLALEKKKNDLLAAELSSCHSSMSSLKIANDYLIKKLDECHATSSSLLYVSFYNRCKDFDIDACVDHASSIAKLNDEIARSNVQLKTCKDVVEK
jgi:hypothetical protein